MPTKVCPDCGKQYHAKQRTTARCRTCFYKSRSRADSKNQRMKKKLLKSRGERCELCGHGEKLHLHHIVPVKDGGETEPHNLMILCQDCHLKAHNGGWRNLQ